MTIELSDLEWQWLNERRHRLIDIKYTDGLTREQALELEAITGRMNEADKPFYDMVYRNICDALGLDLDGPALPDGYSGVGG